VNSHKMPDYHINFATHKAMCHVLGVTRAADILEMVKKTTSYQRTGEPTMIRMLGVLAMNKTCRTGAFVMAVGRSILPFPGRERAVPVLFRNTLRWNSTEDYYTDKLVTTRMKPRDLVDILEYGDDTTSPEAESEESNRTERVFRMTWKEASKYRGGTVDGDCQNIVLGSLEVVIPCMLFGGQGLCHEIDKLCSDSFIELIIAED
jgi:hypothetical protein